MSSPPKKPDTKAPKGSKPTPSPHRVFRRCMTEAPDDPSYDPEAFVFGVSPKGKFGRHFAVPSSKRTPGNAAGASCVSTPHIIAMVGLPARGKTYISKKLSRYLNWIGVDTKVVNLGDYRRKLADYTDHKLFCPENKEGSRIREQVCEEGLSDAIKYLEKEGGEVAVIDATNTTKERRRLLHQRVVVEKGFKLFFIESICTDEKIIEANIKSCKVSSPDYVGKSEAEVIADFKERIKHYEAQYETIDEEEESQLSFLKIFNAGQKYLVHKHEGNVESRIVYYLMNINITPRAIYLTRHGESLYNVAKKLGGDSELSARGKVYAMKLAEYVNGLEEKKLLVWTSFMKRTIQTSKFIKGVHERWKTLNEIDTGVCDGMTYEEIQEQYPEEFAARDKDKYGYRYPRGESYEDLVARLEPVIMELERHGPVIVIAHQAVLRCILAYFEEIDEGDLPYLKVPLHTVLKLEPRAYGCDVQHVPLDVDSVNTHRPKPSIPGTIEEETEQQVQQDEGQGLDQAAGGAPEGASGGAEK